MVDKVKKDDRVVLIDSNGKKIILTTGDKTDRYRGVGVFNPEELIGIDYGKQLEIGNKIFWVLKPSLMDKIHALRRKAQIIIPRDAALIVSFCCIENSHHVLEAGIGSGALTIFLANAVSPDGKVYSYDNRLEFIEHATKNLKRANLLDKVETVHKDITRGISQKNLDAIILDIPNPWDAIKHSYKALKTGGYLCSYSPLISQMEKTVLEIKKHGFIEINNFENIQRKMVVSEKGTRPSFNMLGHTGYLTFARKVL